MSVNANIFNIQRKWKIYYSMKQKRSTEGCSKFKSPETRQVQERFIIELYM